MLDGVEILGLADSVLLSGEDAPVKAEDSPEDSLVVFRFLGWTPDRDEDGVYLARAMGAFANGVSTGGLTPIEAATVVVSAYPEFVDPQLLETVVPSAEGIFSTLSDRGRLPWSEAVSILLALFRKHTGG